MMQSVSLKLTRRLNQSLREAIASMLAILATFVGVLALDPEPGPLVLGVVLTLSLWRSQLDHDWRGRLQAAAVLPLVGLVSLGLGALLLRLPLAGATVSIAGISASIWLRRFGPAAQRAGSLIALPLVVLLVTPYIPAQRLGPALALLMPVIVALIALLTVTLVHWLVQWLQWLPQTVVRLERPAPSSAVASAASRESALRPIASTRMAIQMAAALAVAFAVGFAIFPGHWSWLVLTAFIVNSGNRGRGDVAYKSILRVMGAAAGTLAALVLTLNFGAHDVTTIALMLLAVFLGIWLRPLGYAWWALFVTLALALLQSFIGIQAQLILWPRLEEIVLGAVIGVAAAWFVLPIPSIAVLRRRIADALALLSTALDPATPSPLTEDFIAAVASVEQLAPTFRAWRLLSHRFITIQPADWIDTLNDCLAPASALITRRAIPPALRSELGKARRALREATEILPALQALKRMIDNASRK